MQALLPTPTSTPTSTSTSTPSWDHHGESERARTAWLVTFTDLVSLLLAFFVLLFSMSTLQSDKWEAMSDALSKRLNPAHGAIDPRPAADRNVGGVDVSAGIDLGYLKTLLKHQVQGSALLGDSVVSEIGDRLVVSLPSDLLFAPGAAALQGDAQAALFELGGVLRNIENAILVYGYTDPTPVRGTRFESNWELSLARAVTVANELRRAGYPRDIVSFGVADSRFDDLSTRLAPARRAALARRVDIVINTVKGEF